MPAAKMIRLHKSAQDGWLQKQFFLQRCISGSALLTKFSRIPYSAALPCSRPSLVFRMPAWQAGLLIYNGSLHRCSVRTMVQTIVAERDVTVPQTVVGNRRFRFRTEGLVYQEAETDRNTFAVISLWGKVWGLHACGATRSYTLPPRFFLLTLLFSKTRLKRKDFQEIARMAWAQEVPSSNLGAPTIY
jgi:hypothetical protein